MEIWPISTRVNSPKNDDADLLKPLADADASWRPDGPERAYGNPTHRSRLEGRTALLVEGAMRVGDYPVSGKPYWLTMTGVAALGVVGVVLMLAVQ